MLTIPYISEIFVLAGIASAAVIAVDLASCPQRMRIMHAVWVLTGLWASVFGLWAYYAFGRSRRCTAGERTAPPSGSAPTGRDMAEHSMAGMTSAKMQPDGAERRETARMSGAEQPETARMSGAEQPETARMSGAEQHGIAGMEPDGQSAGSASEVMAGMKMAGMKPREPHDMSGANPHDMTGMSGEKPHEMPGANPHDMTGMSGAKPHEHDMPGANPHEMAGMPGANPHDMTGMPGAKPHEMAGMPGMEMPARPRWQGVVLSTLHCGAGCTLADLVGEWLLWLVPLSIGGSLIAGSWVVDYVLALAFGIGFQYAAIRGMEPATPRRQIVRRAAKADILSLTAWQAGMYGWMAVVIFVLRDGEALPRTSFAFWFMMQIAMGFGFLLSLPVNVWLIRRGVKHAM